MDKINKLPDKSQKHPIRFVIVPLKPHLAKFLIFQDWDKLKHPNKIKDFSFSYFFEPLNSFEFYLIDRLAEILGEQISKRNPNFSYSLCRGKEKINPELELFKDKGYVFIKITFHIVYGSPPERQRKTTLRETVIFLNSILEHCFREFINMFLDYQSPVQALDQIYNAMGLTESEIKKSTLLRYYYRQK